MDDIQNDIRINKTGTLVWGRKRLQQVVLFVVRLKSIMLQNLPIMLSGISFFLPILKIMLTVPIILQIMLIYLHIIIL